MSGHGIRLDVYLNDAAGTHYDIEMQKTSSQGLERRIRYYQGGIDRRCLGKGLDYMDLPESYVIFVCDFDYYHAGLARYERILTFTKTHAIIKTIVTVFSLENKVAVLQSVK